MLGYKPLGQGLKINIPDTIVCEKRNCYGLFTNKEGFVNIKQGVNSASPWLTDVVANAITRQPSSGESRIEDVIVAVEKRANWSAHTQNRLRVITAAMYPATVGETCSAAHDLSGAREELTYQTYIKPSGSTAWSVSSIQPRHLQHRAQESQPPTIWPHQISQLLPIGLAARKRLEPQGTGSMLPHCK